MKKQLEEKFIMTKKDIDPGTVVLIPSDNLAGMKKVNKPLIKKRTMR